MPERAADGDNRVLVLRALLDGGELEDLLTSRLLGRLGEGRLDELLAEGRRCVGVVTAGRDLGHGWLRVDGDRGGLFAEVRLDGDGRVSRLLLRPGYLPVHPPRGRRLLAAAAGLARTAVVPLLFVALAATAPGRVAALLWLAAAASAYAAGRRTEPRWWLGYIARDLLGVVVGLLVEGAVALARLPALATGRVQPWPAALVGVVVAVALGVLYNGRRAGPAPVHLVSPVPGHRLAVVQGESRATNHPATSRPTGSTAPPSWHPRRGRWSRCSTACPTSPSRPAPTRVRPWRWPRATTSSSRSARCG